MLSGNSDNQQGERQDELIPLEPLDEATGPAKLGKVEKQRIDARAGSKGVQQPVHAGRVCRNCDYSLEGLVGVRKCPECGYVFSMRMEEGRHAQLAHAPRRWLRVAAGGTTLLMLGAVVGLVGAYVWGWYASWWAGMLPLCGSVMWAIGVWITTRPQPQSTVKANTLLSERVWLRLVARATQVGWGAVIGAIVLENVSGVSNAAVDVLVLLAFIVALLGLAPVFIVIAGYASWANDDDLWTRLRNCTVFAPIGMVIVALQVDAMLSSGGPAGMPPTPWWLFTTAMVMFMWAAPAMYAMLQVLAVHRLFVYAWEYQRGAEFKDQRFREKAEQAERERGATARAPAAGPSRSTRGEGRS